MALSSDISATFVQNIIPYGYFADRMLNCCSVYFTQNIMLRGRTLDVYCLEYFI